MCCPSSVMEGDVIDALLEVSKFREEDAKVICGTIGKCMNQLFLKIL